MFEISEEKKKEYIRRMLIEVPTWQDRKIARIFECDVQLVTDIREEMVASGGVRVVMEHFWSILLHVVHKPRMNTVFSEKRSL